MERKVAVIGGVGSPAGASIIGILRNCHPPNQPQATNTGDICRAPFTKGVQTHSKGRPHRPPIDTSSTTFPRARRHGSAGRCLVRLTPRLRLLLVGHVLPLGVACPRGHRRIVATSYADIRADLRSSGCRSDVERWRSSTNSVSASAGTRVALATFTVRREPALASSYVLVRPRFRTAAASGILYSNFSTMIALRCPSLSAIAVDRRATSVLYGRAFCQRYGC